MRLQLLVICFLKFHYHMYSLKTLSSCIESSCFGTSFFDYIAKCNLSRINNPFPAYIMPLQTTFLMYLDAVWLKKGCFDVTCESRECIVEEMGFLQRFPLPWTQKIVSNSILTQLLSLEEEEEGNPHLRLWTIQVNHFIPIRMRMDMALLLTNIAGLL